jgi:hypothetical protein
MFNSTDRSCQDLVLTVAAEPGGIKVAARLDAKKAPTVAFRSRPTSQPRLSKRRRDFHTRDTRPAAVFHRETGFPTR